MGHVQPALLGKGTGKPGTVYHCAQPDDGDPAGDGIGWHAGNRTPGTGDHLSWQCIVQSGFRGHQFPAVVFRIHAVNDRTVWDGNDDGIPIPAAEQGSMAYIEPGTGADLPGIRVLLSY